MSWERRTSSGHGARVHISVLEEIVAAQRAASADWVALPWLLRRIGVDDTLRRVHAALDEAGAALEDEDPRRPGELIAFSEHLLRRLLPDE